MVTERETESWLLTPRLLLGATLIGCAVIVGKALGLGFLALLNWWLIAAIVVGLYLMVVVALELYSGFRGPVVSLVRSLQLLFRDAGRCVQCGSALQWILAPDQRLLSRGAQASCPVCEARALAEFSEAASCPVCGALVSANGFCPRCMRVTRVQDK